MPRGRPAKAPTRSLNIRVDVDDLDLLAIIQTVTKVPTAEVVREFLRTYIEQNREALQRLGQRLEQWDTGAQRVARELTERWEADGRPPMLPIQRTDVEHDDERDRQQAEGGAVWPDGSPVVRDDD